jgi:hypothetical protein
VSFAFVDANSSQAMIPTLHADSEITNRALGTCRKRRNQVIGRVFDGFGWLPTTAARMRIGRELAGTVQRSPAKTFPLTGEIRAHYPNSGIRGQ